MYQHFDVLEKVDWRQFKFLNWSVPLSSPMRKFNGRNVPSICFQEINKVKMQASFEVDRYGNRNRKIFFFFNFL